MGVNQRKNYMSENVEAVRQESNEDAPQQQQSLPPAGEQKKLYRIRFRAGGKIFSAVAIIQNLEIDEVVMGTTDHGLEPGRVTGKGFLVPLDQGFEKVPATFTIARRGARDEISKYDNLVQREQEAFKFCQGLIVKLGLVMKLISVERFFNGSKIIFYFTAENRVDFRVLVKELVQEFRTRVEMRQIGVRHETQMLGGLGCCGRELCCSLFMKKFVPVSIKMAKEQDLPLNPSKISGACNRLLCCLTHEFDTYKHLKRDMPRPGKIIIYEEKKYKVTHCNTLKGTINICTVGDKADTMVLEREQWKTATIAKKPRKPTEPSAKSSDKKRSRKSKGSRKWKKK